MKSLKRTLALVLVLVMALGMFSVAGAAFTDEADIQYVEAVNVMAGIGAINGMGDGTFAPTGSVTRAQAAKIITYAVLGPDMAALLPATTSQFSDVDASFAWAIPSIEYLASEDVGAIAGMGDGTFDPNGAVTGNQFAKMLLAVLGIEGNFKGSSWELNVALAAADADIFVGSKAASNSAAATREEACLYAFNAMKYTETGKTVYEVYDKAATADDAKVLYTVDSITEAYILSGNDNTKIVKTNDTTGSILDAFYGLKPATGVDAFGRTTAKWVKKSDEKVVISEIVAAPSFVITEKMDKAGIEKLIGKDADYAKVELADATALAGETGNGTYVEIFMTGKEITNVIVVENELAQVTAVKETAAKGEVPAYTTYTLQVAGEKAVEKVVYATEVADKYESTLVIDGEIAKEDYVIAYADAEEMTYVYPATIVTGTLTSKSSAGVYTIAGEAYALAAGCNATAVEAVDGDSTFGVADTLYAVDAYGYVHAAVKAPAAEVAAAKYAMVLSTKDVTVLVDGALKTEQKATVAYADGTVAEIVYIDAPTATLATAAAVDAAGSFVEIKTTEKGETYFVEADGTDVGAITTKDSTLADGLYANANTLFIVANYNDKKEIDGTVSTYTGIANVPNFENATAMAFKVDKDAIADIVFIYSQAAVVKASDSYVYVVGTYTQSGAEKYVYDVVIKGEASTITVDQLLAKGLYEEIEIEDGKLTNAVPATSEIESIENVGGLFFVGSELTAIADDAVIYTIDADGAVEELSFATLTKIEAEEDGASIVTLTAENGTVTAIYVAVLAELGD